MATTLASVAERTVIRCDECQLVQFPNNSNLCRRCHVSLADEPEPAPVVPIDRNRYGNGAYHGVGSHGLAQSIKAFRLRCGLSQRQLAARVGIPRTYISKIECEAATPTIGSLERLALALDCSIIDLLLGGERNRQDELAELMKDKIVAEVLPFIKKLNQAQKSVLLVKVSDLAAEATRRRIVRT